MLFVPRIEVFISGGSFAHRRFAGLVVERLQERHPTAEVRITDVLADPTRAEESGVVATPQTVRWLPTPTKRIIGEVDDMDQLLAHLELGGARAD